MLRRRPDADADRRLHRRLRRPALRHACRSGASSTCGGSTSCAASASTATCCASARSRPTPRSSRRRWCSKRVPMLVAAAREVGGAQIQNRGTLGGNIANASPAGDTLPVLAAADARVVLRSADRRAHACPSTDFYTGYRTSVRQPDELIAAIEIPPHRRPAVVAQGRHAARAGDLEGDDGRRARRRDVRIGIRIGRADRRARADGRGGAVARRLDRRRAGGAAAGDRADRRRPLDGRVSRAGGGEPAGAVLERR